MKRDNLASGVYKELKQRILSLEYPPGSILQERALAASFGVSRTPAREAIQRLSQEGWLEINARKNIKVRTPSETALQKLFLSRSLLERDAIELIFTENRQEETAGKMRSFLQDMDAARGTLSRFAFISLDQSFHAIPFLMSGNDYLQNFWRCLSEDMIWFGMMAMNENRYDDVIREHSKIIESVESKGCERAVSALLNHLDVTEDILGRKFKEGWLNG